MKTRIFILSIAVVSTLCVSCQPANDCRTINYLLDKAFLEEDREEIIRLYRSTPAECTESVKEHVLKKLRGGTAFEWAVITMELSLVDEGVFLATLRDGSMDDMRFALFWSGQGRMVWTRGFPVLTERWNELRADEHLLKLVLHELLDVSTEALDPVSRPVILSMVTGLLTNEATVNNGLAIRCLFKHFDLARYAKVSMQDAIEEFARTGNADRVRAAVRELNESGVHRE